MCLFLQEDVICFLAIETCFLQKSVPEEVFKGKIINDRLKI